MKNKTATLKEPFSRQEIFFFNFSMFAVLAILSVIVILRAVNSTDRIILIGLLLVFATIMFLKPSPSKSGWRSHFYMALQTFLVANIFVLQPSYYGPFLFFIISIQAIRILPVHKAQLWIVLIAIITIIIDIIFFGWTSGIVKGLVDTFGYLIIAIGGSAVASMEKARTKSSQLFNELTETYNKLQKYTERREELSVAEERNRLARELHDTLGHRLTISIVQLEGAGKLFPKNPERSAQIMKIVQEQLREGIKDLRNTVSRIREPSSMDLPLSKSLMRLVAEFEKATGHTVEASIPFAIPDLPAGHCIALYHAAQEALTNIQKHAKANNIFFGLSFAPGTVSLRVADDGIGIPDDLEISGFGLRGLHERAKEFRGSFEISPHKDGGTCLTFTLKFKPEESHDPEK